MDISSQSNSLAHSCNSFSNSVMDGARSITSSAYMNTKRRQRGTAGVLRWSIYIGNKTGESTEPCLTPKVTVNIDEKKPSHFTDEKHSEKRLIIISNSWTGMFLFINFIKRAWWFTLSKALDTIWTWLLQDKCNRNTYKENQTYVGDNWHKYSQQPVKISGFFNQNRIPQAELANFARGIGRSSWLKLFEYWFL